MDSISDAFLKLHVWRKDSYGPIGFQFDYAQKIYRVEYVFASDEYV